MDVDSAEIQRLLHELELIYADRGLRDNGTRTKCN